MLRSALTILLILTTTNATATVSYADQYILRPIEAAYGLPHGLLIAIEQTESAGRHTARGRAGERGMFQLMPDNVRRFHANPYDTHSAGNAAAYMLQRDHYILRSWNGAIAAYNAGAGNVARRGIRNWGYVNSVLRNLHIYEY